MPTLTRWPLVSGSFGTFRFDFGRFKGFVLCIDLSLGVLRGDLEFLGVAARQIEHGIPQNHLANAAQTACPEFPFDGVVDHQIKRTCIERQLDAIHREQLGVLANQCVFGLGQNAPQRTPLERPKCGEDGESTDQFRNQSEGAQVRGIDIGQRLVFFNNVFGYYLEVRNAHKDKVPEGWIRKQTLTQAERYITEELKALESQILNAKEQAETLEHVAFAALVAACVAEVGPLMANARALGLLDMLASHAESAIQLGYTRPRMHEGQGVQIAEGRHPVIEQQLPAGETYISNDVHLDRDSRQIMMVTGPNMSGKSALLRQTALISLMAQAGSFVPAKSADLGILDRIFTRVGASDNISSGESTFMVEMNETAAILNNLTPRSLVLLDEIGRGTSTYDGVSIAWAIVEHLHKSEDSRPLTLFATHYHELNDMTKRFNRIVNVNVSVKELDGKIVFLRKLAPGGSNHSFGINVAQLAGMPRTLVRRAKEVLSDLEDARGAQPQGDDIHVPTISDVEEGIQMSFFQLDDPSLEAIRDKIMEVDIDHLTPVEALMKLHEIKATLTGKTRESV